MTSLGGVNFDPMDMILATLLVGHQMMLHDKYLTLIVLDKKIFKMFFLLVAIANIHVVLNGMIFFKQLLFL